MSKLIQKKEKANGKDEYYVAKAPQKTIGGKIVIWVLVLLMALGGIGGLVLSLIALGK